VADLSNYAILMVVAFFGSAFIVGLVEGLTGV
jgi:hypothetical protein